MNLRFLFGKTPFLWKYTSSEKRHKPGLREQRLASLPSVLCFVYAVKTVEQYFQHHGFRNVGWRCKGLGYGNCSLRFRNRLVWITEAPQDERLQAQAEDLRILFMKDGQKLVLLAIKESKGALRVVLRGNTLSQKRERGLQQVRCRQLVRGYPCRGQRAFP